VRGLTLSMVVLLTALPSAVLAWGGEGHRIIAALAYERLAPNARQAVDRLIALEEVEHFMGDMHQPLHMTDNGDRGGNEVQASLPGGETANLRHIWDTTLVAAALGPDEAQAEAQLRPLVAANAATWSRGDLNAWASETHLVGVQVAYGRLPAKPPCGGPAPFQALGQDYVDAAVPVVREQLGRAAVRLAIVLNEALG